jgi:tRNA (guanine37-N1)-methyltransferase
MDISVLTLFPELYTPFINTSLIGRARERQLVNIHLQDFFSLCAPKERLDSPTYGPGAGMVLKPTIVEQAIQRQEQHHGTAYKIFFSPHGKKLDQQQLQRLATRAQDKKHLMLVCARYEGMDARVEDYYADEIISIGDYVLMGGDLPALVTLEGLLRYVPGVIGKEESVRSDSFTGPLVDYPEYTDPLEWHGMSVPDIVRSGNHAAIANWRREQAIRRTLIYHFDWLRTHQLSPSLLNEVMAAVPPHYAVLMHDQVMLKEGRVGTSSITSIDIHDIARSALTYGLKNYFLVTSLEDQTKIAQTLIDFWLNEGKEYNIHRHEALKRVHLASSLEHVCTTIEQETGKKPLLLATSAQEQTQKPTITYHDQGVVWRHNRPVILIFGTASGLSHQLLAQCDYVLEPLQGLSTFNHLSVRSAAATVFDRWLGLNPQTSTNYVTP